MPDPKPNAVDLLVEWIESLPPEKARALLGFRFLTAKRRLKPEEEPCPATDRPPET